MFWPSPQDYNEAIQTPEYSFADEQLAKGEPELSPIGLPKPVTGNFASVYRFDIAQHSQQKQIAVKCFLRNVHDQHTRYQQLSQYLSVNHTQYLVDFQYVLQGIRVKTDWFPILKMDWVSGITFDQFLRKHVGNRANIERVAAQFVNLVEGLKRIGIAHGDLQHGNIIVQPADIRLVDYDGMFVPSLSGETANELGHPNYQHPRRTALNFSASLDDFSAWLIHSSLLILAVEPMLFKKFSGGDECILFRQADLRDPQNSRLFSELRDHPNEQINERTQLLLRLLQCPVERLPEFSPKIPILDSIAKSEPAEEVSLIKSNLPDWMLPDDSTATTSDISIANARVRNPASQPKPRTRHIPENLRQAPRFPTDIKWPTIEQYDLAIKQPLASFQDPELADSTPIVRQKITGNHGIIYQLSGKGKTYAVKCFIHDLPERDKRYSEVAKLKAESISRYLIDFQYLKEGIKIHDVNFPILKMEWSQGLPLDQYAWNLLGTANKVGLDKLINDLRQMSLAFQNLGIAHGDIEPSNIMVEQSGEIKLVDYDAIFTPALKDLSCGESGNPNYQHPSRTHVHFGPWLDNYPFLLIDSVLTAMSANAEWRHKYDWNYYLQQIKPRTWSASNKNSPVTRRSRLIKDLQMTKLENVPPLNAAIKL